MFKKILVANRGYFASRAINTIKSMGIKALSVFTKEDSNLFYVYESDFKYPIDANYKNPYLDAKTILNVAIEAKADAIYLGTSNLAYDTYFFNICSEYNITPIATKLDFIVLCKDKLYIKKFANSLDIKTVPGSFNVCSDINELFNYYKEHSKPFFIKPNFSFNSVGLKYIENEAAIEKAYITYLNQTNGLKDRSFIIEEAMLDKKLIKVSALRDNYFNTNILGFIDASINDNNYRNLISETYLDINKNIKNYILNSVKLLCENLNLIGYAEFEFLVDDKTAYLLEINPKLSQTYSIYELCFNIDLIKQAILISSNNKLDLNGKELSLRGYLVQAKIYANEISPHIDDIFIPSYLHIYNELNISNAYTIPAYFDKLLLKISASSRTKLEAINKLKLALNNYIINGTFTNLAEIKSILNNASFLNNTYSLNFKNNYDIETIANNVINSNNEVLAIDFSNNNDNKSYNSMFYGGIMDFNKPAIKKEEEKILRRSLKESYTSKQKELISKIPGKVLKILVEENQSVKEGEVLFVLEAMKMENRIYAERSGLIDKIFVKEQQNIMTGAKLITYK